MNAAAGVNGEHVSLWQPDHWVCSHYQRSDFGPDDQDVWEHLGHCYVDAPGYWDMTDNGGSAR